MADNVTAPVTGEEFATKEVSGVHHPKGINEFVDGGGAPVLVSAANPQPVVDTTGNGLLTTIDGDTSSLAAAVAVTDAVAAASPSGLPMLMVRDDTTSTVTPADGDWVPARANARAAQWIAMDTTLDATNDSIALDARAGIGADPFLSLDLDETEEEIKATTASLYGFYFYNANAALRYLKFYNATAANVTVGTTTPVMTFPIPATSAGTINFPHPVKFATALTAAATTGLAHNDTGAPSANDVILVAIYK